MTNQTADTWSEERIAILTKLWAEGHSSSIIGEMMGLSRNAVVGKVHRLGLEARDTTERKPRKDGRKTGPRVKKRKLLPRIKVTRESVRLVHAGGGNSNAMRLVREVVTSELRCVEVSPRHISLFELTSQTCREPYGDSAPYTFCGHLVLAGYSWCPEHKAINSRAEEMAG